MGSGKREKRSKIGKPLKAKNPSKTKKSSSLSSNRPNPKKKKKKIKDTDNPVSRNNETKDHKELIVSTSSISPAAEQLSFFLDRCRSNNGGRLSSLELESVKDTCILELSQDLGQSADNLGEHMKAAFGSSWKEMLYEKELLEGKIEPGSPAIIAISISALRSLELHRGFRPLTKECPAAKLFSKHMKIEEQVSFLKNRVNIACGTPSRIKKLIDMEALGLKRLRVIVLDMHIDVKGYSLFTLPQIRDEFWDLYRSCFHRKLTQGNLRVCIYGPTPVVSDVKNKGSD